MIGKVFAQDQAKLVSRETAYGGFFEVATVQVEHALFAGGTTRVRREVFVRGESAGALLYDPAGDAVVLVEQFRVGALAGGGHPWLVEVVAGIIDAGETPEVAVRREAREETGCEIKDLHCIARYFPSAGGSSERYHLFCGIVDAKQANGRHGGTGEGEDILVRVVPFAAALRGIETGELCDAATLIGLQWLALNRERFRERCG